MWMKIGKGANTVPAVDVIKLFWRKSRFHQNQEIEYSLF